MVAAWLRGPVHPPREDPVSESLLIGVDGSARSGDAIALGALLAPIMGAPTMLYAHPYGELQSLLGEGEYEQLVRDVAETTASQAQGQFSSDESPSLTLVADRSPASALQKAAEKQNAAAIVVGSSHRGAVGRVFPGGIAQRLLSGAPCPVAVAPAGFASREPSNLGTIAIGFDGSSEAREALRVASGLAKINRGPLVVIAVHNRLAFGNVPVVVSHATVSLNQKLKSELAGDLEKAASEAGLGDDITTHLYEGDPATVLAAESASIGLLVVGSRGYGPVGSVLLGSVGTTLMKEASSPVMIVPRRGTDRPTR